MNINDLWRAADAEAALSAAPTEPVPVSSLSGDDQPRGMNGAEFNEFISQLRVAMKPAFDEQARVWEQEGPAAQFAFDATGAALDMIGGNCPVQAEGAVDGKRFYFRARGEEWQFHVADTDEQIFGEPVFYIERDYGSSAFDAGWMPRHEALQCIVAAIGEYRAAQGTSAREG